MSDTETYSAAGFECPHCGHLHRYWTERVVERENKTCDECKKPFVWWTKVTVGFYADRPEVAHDD